jgi:hypothetical protein
MRLGGLQGYYIIAEKISWTRPQFILITQCPSHSGFTTETELSFLQTSDGVLRSIKILVLPY